MKIKKNQLGSSIKSWRKQRRLTQEDFADLLKISVHSVSSIERGVNFPTIKTLEKMSNVLNVPISEFYRSTETHNISENDNKKQFLINSILGVLYKLNSEQLNIVLKQVGAFERG